MVGLNDLFLHLWMNMITRQAWLWGLKKVTLIKHSLQVPVQCYKNVSYYPNVSEPNVEIISHALTNIYILNEDYTSLLPYNHLQMRNNFLCKLNIIISLQSYTHYSRDRFSYKETREWIAWMTCLYFLLRFSPFKFFSVYLIPLFFTSHPYFANY